MPISLTNLAGTNELTPETALAWLKSGDCQVPAYISEDCLDLFVSTRSATYGFLQCKEFLSDIDGFYFARKGIKVALKNLDGYDRHLRAQGVTNELARDVLGLKKAEKVAPELLAFVRSVVEGVLKEERDYIVECRLSLDAQLQWHQQGPVDKSRLSSAQLEDVFSAFVKEANPSKAKDKAKFAYYDPIRNRLMRLGFVVSPPGTALGAVFPEKDWIKNYAAPKFWQEAKQITDALLLRYRLIGDDPSSLTRLLMPTSEQWRGARDALVSAVGCLCVSWTRHRASGKIVYVPILGLSGVIKEPARAPYFERYCRHLALPAWEKDPEIPRVGKYLPSKGLKDKQAQSGKEYTAIRPLLQRKDLAQDSEEAQRVSAFKKLQAQVKVQADTEQRDYNLSKGDKELANELEVNYETMIRRANLVALGYRARTLLRLRTPARQALFSYVSFREEKSSDALKIETLQPAALGPDLWICGWHSLNCAEPAALMTASSYFCEGSDVLVCFPYEGFNETGDARNRPKETCPWCAAVELGFRSLSENRGGVDASVASGTWLTQFTCTILDETGVLPVNRGFDAFDDRNPIMSSTRRALAGDGSSLVKNKDLEARAYSDVVETKIGRLRSMYHLLGLLDPGVIALDKPLYAHAGMGALQQFML